MPVDRVRNIPSIQEGSSEKKLKIDNAHVDQSDMEIDSDEGCIERYLAKMRKFRNYPPAQFTYHAFMNRRDNWTVDNITPILDYARKHGLEVRAWGNEQTAINLVVVKDPDMSEDSGWDLYELMQGKFDSYGLSSWYEWDKYGIPVYTGEDVKVEPLKNNFGIRVGKSNEDCVVLA